MSHLVSFSDRCQGIHCSLCSTFVHFEISHNKKVVLNKLYNSVMCDYFPCELKTDFLNSRSLTPREFNSYGARRGNDAVMTRGTFANIKLFNKFIGKPAPKTIHFPSGQTVRMYAKYIQMQLLTKSKFALKTFVFLFIYS